MDYYIELIESDFFIAAENKEAALNALFDMWTPDKDSLMSGWSTRGDTWYSWMNNSADNWRNRNIGSLEEGLSLWKYDPNTDAEGNIIGLWFESSKIGDEDKLFDALAPFVRAGSYLNYRGEDGALWQWFFDGNKVIEKIGKVEYL